MNKIHVCWLILICLLFPAAGESISVERTVLVSPQPGTFTVNVSSAVNTQTNSTLVVYTKHTGFNSKHSIWGVLLKSDGNRSGSPFQIVSGPNAWNPQVVYNRAANQFVLVYGNAITSRTRFEVFAQKLTATGRRSGPPLRISLAADRGKNISSSRPRIVYDSTTDAFFVVFTRNALETGTSIEQGLFGTVLNTNVTVRKAPVLMSPLAGDGPSNRGPVVNSMDVHGPSKKILIAGYVQSTEPGFSVQYFVAKADPTLQRPQIALTKLKSGLSSGAAPHASLLKVAGGNMVGLFVEGTGIRRRRINNLGTPVGPTSLFFTGSVQQVPLEFPITVYASQGNRSESAALGLDDSSQGAAKLWMQTTNSAGAATGQPLELRSNYTGVNPSAITQLPINSDTGFWYAVVIVEGAQLSEPPATTESSGLAILKVNTAP